MEMGYSIEDDSDSYSVYSEVDEGEEEALSLCDLPLGEAHQEYLPTPHNSEAFEFFSTDVPPHISSTENIIFCGKILPYRSGYKDETANNHQDHHHRNSLLHPKSESLNDLQRSHSTSKGGGGDKFMRNSRSLDYKKLHRDSSLKRISSSSTNDRILDGKYFGRVPVSPIQTTTTKPKWRLLMFGLMKTPREMELKDIRNRQSRLIPSSFFTVSSVNKREEEKGSWKLLRALSCKGQANTVITASLSCI